MKRFWCSCSECPEEWVAEFISEFGLLVATDKYGEECECGGEVQVGDEYQKGDCD